MTPESVELLRTWGWITRGLAGVELRQSRARLDKASARNNKLQKLAVPTRKIAVRVNRVGVQTTATWGHQAQGLAPKRMKVIRAAAGGHAFRQSLGSLDLVFDLVNSPFKTRLRGFFSSIGLPLRLSFPRSAGRCFLKRGKSVGAVSTRRLTHGRRLQGQWHFSAM